MKRMIMTAGPTRAAWAVLLVTLLFCTWVPSAAAEDAAAGLLSGRDSADTSGETGAAETGTPESDTGAGTTADKTVRVTGSSGTTIRTGDPVDAPVSYGLRVLAAREEMVLSGLCGNELALHKDDICRALNLSAVPGIVLTSLPSPDTGTLYVGAAGAAVGQSIPAEALSLVSFSPADGDEPCQAAFRFTVPGSGYEMSCRLCLLTAVNFTPTAALAPALALEINTFCDVPVTGCLSGYDPEGDNVIYEIVSYPAHGLITLDDRATGAYTYIPDRSYLGGDSFSYVVRDEWGNWSAAATVTITVSAVPAAVTYADLDGNVCRAAALAVSAAGLMNGTRVGDRDYFRPDAPMTRSEFLVTAMNAAGLKPDGKLSDVEVSRLLAPFTDADDLPDAMKPYIALALQNGTITGRTNAAGDQVLLPDQSISRAEASVLLSNVIGYASMTTVNAFADVDALPAWSVPAFTSLKALGILQAPDGAANPSAVLTRGDAAVWFARTVQLVGR